MRYACTRFPYANVEALVDLTKISDPVMMRIVVKKSPLIIKNGDPFM